MKFVMKLIEAQTSIYQTHNNTNGLGDSPTTSNNSLPIGLSYQKPVKLFNCFVEEYNGVIIDNIKYYLTTHKTQNGEMLYRKDCDQLNIFYTISDKGVTKYKDKIK